MCSIQTTHESFTRSLRVIPNCWRTKNLGAKVLSARPAKVLNHLITSLTRCRCNARKHVAESGEIRLRKTKRIAEVQGNFPNFKQNVAEKEYLSSQKSAKASRCLAVVVSEQEGSKKWQLGG